jgi:hypothetical protein
MGENRTSDREAIHNTLVRYCRGVDRGDADLILSCYHPEGIEDHGPFYGSASDFVAHVCVPSFDLYASMMHLIANEYVEFDGPDEANTETYIIAHMRRLEDDRNVLETFAGRYIDRFERRDQEWRIVRRVLVYEWADSKVLADGFPPELGSFEHGHRFDSDIAYTRTTSRPGREWGPTSSNDVRQAQNSLSRVGAQDS